jgi:hypothetical protein
VSLKSHFERKIQNPFSWILFSPHPPLLSKINFLRRLQTKKPELMFWFFLSVLEMGVLSIFNFVKLKLTTYISTIKG